MVVSSEKISDKFLRVNSCSRQVLSDKDYVTYRKKGRVDYHILYITQGRCMTEVDGELQTVNAGSLILFKPREPQLYCFCAADLPVSCYIHFSGTDCKELLVRAGLYSNRISHIGVSHSLENIFAQLADEFALKKPFYEEICASLLLKFIAVAGRKLNYIENKIQSNSVYNAIDEVRKKMHAEYYKNPTVKEYAKLCNLSCDRFSHAFRERTGLSPKKYLLKIKIDKACEILSGTDLNITETAEAVGIGDANYFSRLVKKYTGHPPKYFKAL